VARQSLATKTGLSTLVQPASSSTVNDCRQAGRSLRRLEVTEITTPVKAWVPHGASLDEVERLASHCRACALYQRATQTVFGEGPPGAPVMLVGEQPGDQEDLLGRPFVGPAGKLLDKALAEAGIAREETYVTNAVKHFKWTKRGKRRIHEKPNGRERQACSPGSKPRSNSSHRRFSYAWEQLRRNRCWARRSASRSIAASFCKGGRR
jgi:uracil-DNA glycosylase family protein